MTGTLPLHMRSSEEVYPLLGEAPTSRLSRAETPDPQPPYQQAAYMMKPTHHHSTTAYGSIPVVPRADQHNSETESDSDGSCTAVSSSGSSLQSILRIPSCRSIKKQVSVEFALDVSDDEDDKTDGICSARCMPRRLTIEEKAALYQVRPDLELIPTVLLVEELEELRRKRQRKLLFSLLGASLVMLMMLMFYYLVSQM